MCRSNIPLNLFSENNGLLRNETKNRSQAFELPEIKFSRFSAPYNFDVIKADEGTQMKTRELQCDSVTK